VCKHGNFKKVRKTGQFTAFQEEKYNDKNKSSYEYVYVTDYGVRYHRDENCSEINRTIIEISCNKVTGMRACRLCAAGDN